jgi:threonine/homoserine efflux transporter RhtA
MDAHPVAVLAAVSGASFLAGAVLGSRFGRAILLAAIPFALERLVASELAPRLWSYMEGLMREVDMDPVQHDPTAA